MIPDIEQKFKLLQVQIFLLLSEDGEGRTTLKRQNILSAFFLLPFKVFIVDFSFELLKRYLLLDFLALAFTG